MSTNSVFNCIFSVTQIFSYANNWLTNQNEENREMYLLIQITKIIILSTYQGIISLFRLGRVS